MVRNAGRMNLTDLKHELRTLAQARFTTDGIYFDSLEGQAWMKRFFQDQLEGLEVELFDTGALITDEATNLPATSTFVPPNLEPRMYCRARVSKNRGQMCGVD